MRKYFASYQFAVQGKSGFGNIILTADTSIQNIGDVKAAQDGILRQLIDEHGSMFNAASVTIINLVELMPEPYDVVLKSIESQKTES